MSKEIADEYASSLSDLTVNSKPLINMLTILAEENIDHAGVIVETVEKHLEKVQPDIKLPVLYLVDSIIKNVGGAYTQKFSQSIVNMFTRTFKQVDEKVRSQMFKLRETWHDVFPATKLYQLDVKVNLIDPAWPIQAQPQQSNIHVNPNFLKKNAPTTSAVPVAPTDEEEKMRNILAKKEQELLMLQRKKVEMELEQTRRQLEMAEKNAKKVTPTVPPVVPAPSMPVALVNPVVAPVLPMPSEIVSIPVRQRLGPPVNKPGGRIAPVSAALAAARRDPRLARAPPHPPRAPAATPAPPPPPPATIVSNMFDIKPLERVTKRKNVITIDVRPDAAERPPARDPRRRDPRLLNKRDDRVRHKPRVRPPDEPNNDLPELMDIPDVKRISKLPPIPKIRREPVRTENNEPPPEQAVPKRKKEIVREERKKRREAVSGKDSSGNSSPEKKVRVKDIKDIKDIKEKECPKDKEVRRRRERRPEPEAEKVPEEVVAFKELKNYHKERYMRRNKETSESPERAAAEKPPTPTAAPDNDASSVPDVVVENKDVDLRVLHPVVNEAKAAPVSQKRSSTEMLEGKPKKSKIDKFDVLFGNEDVDLRQLPQVEEITAPPPPSLSESPKPEPMVEDVENNVPSPEKSPRKDWNEVKEKSEDGKKTPAKLDLERVRAKLAEATKGKDRLGRPFLFSKSPSIERERRRTLSTEDTDLRTDSPEDYDAEDNKKSISIIMSQAKEQFTDGQLDKNQYNTLMYQVLQLNEKLKLKEAKQRESLEVSKRKLKAHIQEENHKVISPKSSPNTFGDIDERITPAPFLDTPPDSQSYKAQDSDMRMNSLPPLDNIDGPPPGFLPMPPAMPVFGPFPPGWRGPRPRVDEYVPRRFRGPLPPFYRGSFDKRGPWPPFDLRQPLPQLPTPKIGMCQGENPIQAYERTVSPPPLGATGVVIPPTDFNVLEYIDKDPVKTIQIDGIPREIRFYGETAVIMMDWDDPREIKFLPGCRRITFDNKDSILLSFSEGYKQVEIDDQVFNIRFGAPTRELYINGRWFECFFGGQPLGVIIDGKPRLVHLEGPLPQVDIGKTKRTDLVAGKINLIVNAVHMCPVYLDSKVQKFHVNGKFFTIRFVDALRTVLINEQPFKVEFGDLPKPIYVGSEKYFIRFSALPRHVKPGQIKIENMEGASLPTVVEPKVGFENIHDQNAMETDQDSLPRPQKTPSPETTTENQGLDMLASVMPSTIVPASGSEYSLAEPLFSKPDKIPGLETPSAEEKPKPILPILGNINVNDLFAKLVATGIVQVPKDIKEESKEDIKNAAAEELKNKMKEDKNVIHKVDLLKPETLRVKQPGLVARLYGGMQCSGCGARFPPEHTVRYSQHLDWHFRQNRRDRDSARRAHSRHWHYDMSDWLQYEEIEDLEEREKSWFETAGAEESGGVVGGASLEPPPEAPSVAAGAPADQHCALCGDAFHQFYNEDKEEWHLRNSVRHEDENYHPLCFQDYKASLTKDEPAETPSDDVVPIDKVEEAIEIKDVDEDVNDQSDNESVVEVIETNENMEPVEIDEGEEDDVIYKAEPVEEVVVEDEADTDDETTAARAERDRRAHIDFSNVKVKQEPVDPDDEPVVTAEEETVQHNIDTTQTTVLSSIDGNVQLETAPPPAVMPIGGIRINISKSIPSFVTNNLDDRMLEDVSADDEPLPPGEEPELEFKLKPGLEEFQFSRQPPVSRGSELSGLCSIM